MNYKNVQKKIALFGILAFIVSCGVLFGQPDTVQATTYNATVTIDAGTTTNMQNYGMQGLNNPMQKDVLEHTDPNVINFIKPFDLGWIRWPSGTAGMVFNWKTGLSDQEYALNIYKEFPQYHRELNWMLNQKGTQIPERLSDFRDLLQQVGSKAIIMVTPLDSTTAVYDLAKFVKENNIPVIYWEMANEPHLWRNADREMFFKDGADYINQMKPYADKIKSVLPDAKIIIAYGNNQVNDWGQNIYNSFPNPWWDGVTFHRYESYGATKDVALKDANTNLDGTLSYIDNHVVAYMRDQNAPIFIGEYGVKLSDDNVLNGTLYHGLFLAESNLRFSTHPNVKYFGGYNLLGGYMNPSIDNIDKARDAAQRGQTIDTTQLNFGLYSNAPAVMTEVSDIAINNSSKMFTTTVTGGATVDKNSGTMPAIYAQAFKGDYDGKNYLVIVNKSDSTHTVTLKDGSGNNITAALTKIWAEAPLDANNNPDPLAVNSETATNNVYIRNGSTSNPVSIAPYSVTRVEWTESRAQPVPKEPWITTANVLSNSSVDLKWMKADGATSYNIKYGTTSGTYTTTINSITNTNYTVTGLSAGNTYYFKIEAVNATGTTGSTNEASAKMSAPDSPLMRWAVRFIDGKVRVEWQSVPGATGYKVKYGTTSGSYTNIIDVGNMCGTIVNGLTVNNNNPVTYYFVVTAYNGIGESPISTEDNASPISNPGMPPIGAYVSSQTSTSATITWTPSHRSFFEGFFETGDGSATGWTVQKGSAYSVVDHPDPTRDTKVFASPSGAGDAIVTKGVSNQYDYDIATRVYVTSYNSNGITGVVARLQDSNNYYTFKYSAATDQFILQKVVNGTTTLLGSSYRSDLGSPDNGDMRLTLRVSGNALSAYVNDRLAVEATDSAFSSGYFGLLTNNQSAYFDEVRAKVAFLDTTTTYKLYRSTSPDGTYTFVADITNGNQYTDTGLTAGTVYYYKLKGQNNQSESIRYSNIATKK